MPELIIQPADLSLPEHQQAVLEMLNAYSCDPFGDGKPLEAEVQSRLISGLQQHPTTLIFLAWQHSEPVGIAVCFRGFSTFKAQPLINIHDFFVKPALRGQGVGRKLLHAVEKTARELGCCKLTLEVLEHNTRARSLYQDLGFAQATCVPAAGGALFLSKPL